MSIAIWVQVPSPKIDLGETTGGLSDDRPLFTEGEVPTDIGMDPIVDVRPLKRVAKGLPEADPVRRLIEGEPDFLPRSVLAAKADSWVLLLLRAD